MLKAVSASDPLDSELPTNIEILDKDISKGHYRLSNNIPTVMSNSEKTEYGNDWSTYQERNSHLEKHKRQQYLLILRQCTQLLQDNMKEDTAWHDTSTSYNHLSLLQLIEKITLAHTEDQYLFATVYDHDLTFYTFHQVSL